MFHWFDRILRKKDTEQQLDSELRFHLERQIAEYRAAGMSPDEARRRARLEFGGLEQVKEQVRDTRRFRLLDEFAQDVRFAFRMLRKSPGFTAVAVLTLALGIGANTAIFSVVYGVMLRPLPYPQPDRIMQLSWKWSSPSSKSFTHLQFRYCQDHSRAFQHLASFTGVGFNLAGSARAERVRGLHVSADYFRVLGVNPLLGREFSVEEDQGDGQRVAILSYGLWQDHFGADPAILGHAISLDGKSFTVIGVMSRGYRDWPMPDVWAPMALVARTMGGGSNLGVIGRLKPGVTSPQAQADMNLVSEQYLHEYPQFAQRLSRVPRAERGIGVHEYGSAIGSGLQPYLLILFGAIAFVLLIACANVANLLLSRATSRQREIAVRTALGASRFRLVRQLLTESVMLAILGGGLGALLAYFGLDVLLAMDPLHLPRTDQIHLDVWALGFTLGVAVLTGILFGLAPAYEALRTHLSEALKESSSRALGAASGGRARGALVVGEIALSLILLASAGLMMETIVKLLRTDPGFDPAHVLAAQTWLTNPRFNSTAAISRYLDGVTKRIVGIPGVEAAGAVVAGLPLERGGNMPMTVAGKGEMFSADYRVVTPGYFAALGIALQRGRFFTNQDSEGSAGVAIVNEAFARRHFPGRGALGGQVNIAPNQDEFADRPREIIGIVRDVKSFLDEAAGPAVFIPATQAPAATTRLFQSWFPTYLVVRMTGDPTQLSKTVMEAAQQADPTQPFGDARTMVQILGHSVDFRSSITTLLSLFAGLAVALAGVGVYSAMSYSVAQRTHEIGIRMALGAEPRDILRLVAIRGLRLALAGVALGLAGATIATRILTGLLYHVRPYDPVALAGVALLLMAVALLASYVPARRATRVDPCVALRYE